MHDTSICFQIVGGLILKVTLQVYSLKTFASLSELLSNSLGFKYVFPGAVYSVYQLFVFVLLFSISINGINY